MNGTSAAVAAEVREAARRRLRRLTLGVALGGVGGVALLAGVAAATLPGHSRTASAAASTEPADDSANGVTTTDGTTDQGIQAPSAAPRSGYGSRAHAVSGGSR